MGNMNAFLPVNMLHSIKNNLDLGSRSDRPRNYARTRRTVPLLLPLASPRHAACFAAQARS